MTTRSLFVFALACALLLAGLATQNGGVVALAIPLLVYFTVGQLSRPDALQISVTRSLSANKSTPGAPVTVTLTLVNTGADVDEAVIIDSVPDGLKVVEGEGETHLLTALPSGQPVTLSYVVRAQRGDYRFNAVGVWANDMFELSRRQASLPSSAQLLILPDTSKVQPISIRPQRTHGFIGPIPTRRAGIGSDFLAVRNYQPGDRLRQINWRLSAKRLDRALYTNTLEQQRITDVGLILDARQARDVRTSDGSLFEYSVQAAGSLAEEFLRAGHRVGLLVYGSGGLTSVYPGYGRLQRRRILHVLGRATPGQHMFYENLKELPTRFFAAQSQLVYIGPADRNDIATLMTLRARGYAVIVLSPNAVSFEMRAMNPAWQTPQTSVHALAARIALAEREQGIRQLRRHGIQVIDWDVREPLETVVVSALAHQPTQRGMSIRP